MPEAEFESDDLTEFERLKEGVRKDQNHRKEWMQEARECYDFVAGNQWSAEDSAFLKLQNRPIVAFNRIDPIIDSVSGLEVNNRQEVRYFPRHIGDAGVDELMSGASKWVRDECNAEDEESDAFRDQVICGEGWTETRLDYDVDPDGKILIDRIDPFEMFPDCNSKKKNYEDARRVTRIRDLPMSVCEDMFPDADPSDLHAAWAMDTGSEAHSPHDAIQAVFYTEDQTDLIDKNRVLCRIVEVQWWDHEPIYRVLDPMTQQQISLQPDEHAKLKERLSMLGIPLQSVKQKQKKFYKAWLGNKILEKKPGPVEGGFTLKGFTGKRDRNKGTYYGLVRAMIDPQKWANKWLSQVMHIVNTNAKAGIMAEEGAFSNPQEAIDEWADPSSVTLLKTGAISGNKIAPKPQTPWPSGLEGLMQFAVSSIRDASGVNLEMLGQADRDQPGVLEHQRKQAAMTVLAGMFDSLRRYRKEQGRLLLYYITHFLSDGRLIRIGGQDEAQYVPLVRRPDTVKYDVIIDDTPNSVNLKEQAWGALTQLMPMLQRMPIPLPVWLSVLKYSPLPAALVSEISSTLQQQAQKPPPPDPKLQVAQLNAQIKQAELQGKQMELQQQAHDRQADLQMQQMQSNDAQTRAQVDAAKIQAQVQQMSLDAEKTGSEIFKNRTSGLLSLAQAEATSHEVTLDHVKTIVDSVTKLNPPAPPSKGGPS